LLVNGLITVLQEMGDVQVVGSACGGRQLIDMLRTQSIDLVLLDLNMPQLDGIATLKIIRKEFPQLKVIVFTNYHQSRLISEIKKLGANGYLLKTSNSLILKDAIRAVAKGDTYFVDESNIVETTSLFLDDFVKTYQVTKREVEIMKMIAAGLTTKQIS